MTNRTEDGVRPVELARGIERALASREDVAAAYLFGSGAGGRRTQLSDVDVAVLMIESPPDDDDGSRDQALAEIGTMLAAELPPGAGEVDLTDIERLPLALRGRILTEGRLALSRDEVRRVRFEATTRLRYHDFHPFLRTDTREGLRALRAHYLG